MSTLAKVNLWGSTIGAVSLPEGDRVAAFEYSPPFAASGIEISPFQMPLEAGRIYRFPALSPESFDGLPGLLADSLPDRYGNALIDAWLATRGREPGSFDAVERLCYIGRRGMGALEFAPAQGPRPTPSHVLDVEALVELAAEVLAERDEPLGIAAQVREDARPCGRSSGSGHPPEARARRRWSRSTQRRTRCARVSSTPTPGSSTGSSSSTGSKTRVATSAPPGLWRDRVGLRRDGAAGGNRDDGVPAAGGGRAAPLHDPALRSHGGRRQAPHAVARRHLAPRLPPARCQLLRAGLPGDPPARPPP